MTSSKQHMTTDFRSDFRSVHMNRPVKEIRALIEALRLQAIEHRLPPRRFVDIPTDEIWLIDSGSVFIYRDQGRQLLFIASPPVILGLGRFFVPASEIFTLEFKDTQIIWRLPADKATKIIDNLSLWKSVACVTTYYLSMTLENNFRLVKKNDFDIMKSLIVEFMHLDKNVRDSISLSSYIISKGLVSRSNVMRILSDLNKCGYITIERGRLKNIDFLPVSI